MTTGPNQRPGAPAPGFGADDSDSHWSQGGSGAAALNQPADVPDHIPGRVPHQRARWYQALAALCGLLIAVLIGVTCVDVVGRYLFNTPFGGAYEVTQLALAALVFAALPLTTADGGHVEVDLALHLFSPRAQAVMGWLAGWVSAVALVWFAWRLTALGLTQWHDGARTNALAVPLAPLAFAAALACALSALILILRRPE